MNGLLLGLLSFGAIGLYLIGGERRGRGLRLLGVVLHRYGAAGVHAALEHHRHDRAHPLQAPRRRPRRGSGPLITTVNDLVAVTAYYGLAWLLLIEILHFLRLSKSITF